MLGLGGHLPEVIIVLVVILIIWGPGKLPDMGAALGKGIREFRKATADVRDSVVSATTTPPVNSVPTTSDSVPAAAQSTAQPSDATADSVPR
jgi:sec-independent protein translocase protein TatA